MNIISEDELLLYFYRDGLSDIRQAQITALLISDQQLAARYQLIRAELAQIPAATPIAPSAAAQMRWQLRLQQRAAPADAPRARWPLALAGATIMLLGMAIGTRIAENQAPLVTSPQVSNNSGTPLRRGLHSHFADARSVLASLPGDDPEQRRALLNDIVEQNQLFERAALAQGDERLARVLRAFEPVLIELAQAPSDGSSDAARAQLEFELTIMQTKLSRSPSKIVQSL